MYIINDSGGGQKMKPTAILIALLVLSLAMNVYLALRQATTPHVNIDLKTEYISLAESHDDFQALDARWPQCSNGWNKNNNHRGRRRTV